jgi:hypothetical protein
VGGRAELGMCSAFKINLSVGAEISKSQSPKGVLEEMRIYKKYNTLITYLETFLYASISQYLTLNFPTSVTSKLFSDFIKNSEY